MSLIKTKQQQLQTKPKLNLTLYIPVTSVFYAIHRLSSRSPSSKL